MIVLLEPLTIDGALTINGNVGIGTSTPSTKLEVVGDLKVTGDISGTKNFSFLNTSSIDQTRQMINLWTTVYGIGIQTNTQYFRTGKNFAWYKGGTHDKVELNAGKGGIVQMVIKDDKVGIGTDNPQGKLHVNNGRVDFTYGKKPFIGLQSPATHNRAQLVLSSSYSDIVIASSATNNAGRGSTLTFAAYNFNPDTESEYSKWVINQGSWNLRKQFLEFGYLDKGEENPHSSISDQATVITLDGINKRVGIGTRNPTSKLHVENGELSFGSNGRQMINLYGTEYGIGTQADTQYFRSGKNFAWYKGGDHDTAILGAGKGGIVQMVILGNGNVGIGTTAPTKKLEVAGDLKVTESISGKIDATSITSGLLDANRIPNLSANKITTDTFNVARIPTLTADKIPTLTADKIPNLSANKITTDTFNVARIPTLTADKIPNLSANKITAGTFPGDISVATKLSFGSSTRQMINLWGTEYGIGIQGSTQYFRTANHFAWYKGGVHVDNGLTAGTTQNKGTVQMVILENGNVGIGTANPTKGKVQIEGYFSYQDTRAYYYMRHDGTNKFSSCPNPYSLWVSNSIGATEFTAFSDLRIKEIQGHSDSQADLQTLLQIEVTDYYYKDKISNGDSPKKKVIGQQVAAIYPQAVSTNTDTVPDIFQFAVIAENWVTLSNHNLKVGERVKIQWEETTEVFTVEAIEVNTFKISLNHVGDIFVYGREVDDFHVVDYDALSMLHISATQEIYKLVKNLKEEVERIKTGKLESV